MDVEFIPPKEKGFVKLYRCISPLLYHWGITFGLQIPILAYLAVIALVQAGGDEDVYVTRLLEMVSQYTLPILLVTSLCVLPLMTFLMQRDYIRYDGGRGKIWKVYDNISNKSTKQVLTVVILAVSFCITLNNLITISGIANLFPGYDEIAEDIFASNIGMQLLVVGFVVPIVEELVFRGLVYHRIKFYSSVPVAIGVSAVLFGIYHGNVVQFLYASLMGIVLAYVYEKYKSVMWPIVFHMLSNCTSVVISAPKVLEVFTDYAWVWLAIMILSAVGAIASLYWIIKDAK